MRKLFAQALMSNADYNIALLPAYAELLASVEVADRVRHLQFSALRQLQGQLAQYESLGYAEHLLYHIAEKKGWMILSVTSKTEMERLLKPSVPHYDGNRFITDSYHIPEEELICWSETSLRAPLNEIGYKRYSHLFKSIFPEQWKEIFHAR